MKKFIVTILIMVSLLVGCAPNSAETDRLNSEVDRLNQENARIKSQVIQLENQLAQQGTKSDNRKATAKFAEQALGFQRVIWDAVGTWMELGTQKYLRTLRQSPPKTPDQQAAGAADKVRIIVEKTISSIEQLYAPPEAIQAKKRLLSEADSVLRALINIVLFYANAPSEEFTRDYLWGEDFIHNVYYKPYNELRRDLTDLLLEYSQ